MTLEEQIKVMQHFSNGGEIEYTYDQYDNWNSVGKPTWNWDEFTYRIKETPVDETLYEWMLKDENNRWRILDGLRTEASMSREFKHRIYRITGRRWKPEELNQKDIPCTNI